MEVILSIIVPTYNHGDYIVECLDSILMQKTKYNYEVLVGDDCSTDDTREKLMNWEKEHPGLFDIRYRDHNMYYESPDNPTELVKRAKGKYIIILEGDDYWTDENKLERQLDFLEKNPEYIAVAHNCVVVDRDSKRMDEEYSECKETEYTFSHYVSNILPGQTATFMYKNIHKSRKYNSDVLEIGLWPGDLMKYFVCLCYGRVYCIQEVMSAYRHIKNQGSSFSATNKYDFKKDLNWNEKLLSFAKSSGKADAIKVANIKYIHSLLVGLKLKKIPFKIFINMILSNVRPLMTCYWFCIYYINGRVLKRRIWLYINRQNYYKGI